MRCRPYMFHICLIFPLSPNSIFSPSIGHSIPRLAFPVVRFPSGTHWMDCWIYSMYYVAHIVSAVQASGVFSPQPHLTMPAITI